MAEGGAKDVGTSIPATGGGADGKGPKAGAGIPVIAAAHGKSTSTTYSVISGGRITLRDEAAQQEFTGMSVTDTIASIDRVTDTFASINRDTDNTLNSLKPIFDKEKIEAGFEIVAEATRQVGQFINNRANEADGIKA